MKSSVLCLFLIFISFCTSAQTKEKLFHQSFNFLEDMLVNDNKFSFKKAVLSVENAYLDDQLDTVFIDKKLKIMYNISKSLIENHILEYQENDGVKVSKWASVYQIMCDTIPLEINGKLYKHNPFGYNFNDVFGRENRENLFVSKLLQSHKGNCRSLPYLYKILCEELGVNAHLALAPNHIYIKHQNKKNGWYNTELTSGIFPVDAWIMASGYVHLDAITNGVYMKALNNKESIALLLIDLADNYNVKIPNNDGVFVLQCCELAIANFPHFANALILKAETIKKRIKAEPDEDKSNQQRTDLENQYKFIHKIGYRHMPEEMYINWLISLKKERDKYENKKINTFNNN